jgi:hypothetical protein
MISKNALKNMNKPFTSLSLRALAVGAVVLLVQNARSQSVVLYTDSTVNQNQNFNQASGVTFGNEVVLAGTSPTDVISQIAFQFDLTGTAAGLAGETIDVEFFQNNSSTLLNGDPEPSTVLWNSGVSTLASQGLAAFTTGSTLTLAVPSITVPADFTWAVTFGSLQAGDSAGLSEYNPVTVGFNYDDAWVETGGVWALDKATGANPPYLFGATITGSVPEPSTIALGVMGVCGFLARRRKS